VWMCRCSCVCAYAHLRVCDARACARVCGCVGSRVCAHARVCVCVHMCVFVCAHACACVRACVCVCECDHFVRARVCQVCKCACVCAGTSSRLLRRQMGDCPSLCHFNPRNLGRTHTTCARNRPALCSDQASNGRVLTQVLDADVRLQTRMRVVGDAEHAKTVLGQWLHRPFSRSRHSAKHARACDHTRIPVLYRRSSPILQQANFDTVHSRGGVESAEHTSACAHAPTHAPTHALTNARTHARKHSRTLTHALTHAHSRALTRLVRRLRPSFYWHPGCRPSSTIRRSTNLGSTRTSGCASALTC
jgi:hypothetical protein